MELDPLEELTAETRNKLQRFCTLVDSLKEGKTVSNQILIETEKDLNKAISALNMIDKHADKHKS